MTQFFAQGVKQCQGAIDGAGPTVDSEFHRHLLDARLTDSGAAVRFIILQVAESLFRRLLTLLARHRPR